ncbi:hypothetical protein DM01DRAFT_1407130 [Hesseltinella vesiculosa]|uniref:Rab-GAP TBC domain-containing protein n=1 Tax=Hesseltinella vesiculosa TaxID=101127 RepID=A0A1X2GJA9_9FUNG|nr:hypothetical protein DM01DRAFT_1407130 [Hesseltinella vesiculosa]
MPDQAIKSIDSSLNFTAIADTLHPKIADNLLLSQLALRKRLHSHEPPPCLPRLQHDNDHSFIFWQQLSQDYELMAQQYPKVLLAQLQHGGIPPFARASVFQAMAHCPHSPLLQTYHDHLPSLPTLFADRISQDLNDLYPLHPQSDVVISVLQVYLLYDPTSTYHPNWLHLLVPLSQYLAPDQTFCVLVRLMDHFGLKAMVTSRVNDTPVQVFDMVLDEHFPLVKQHLLEHHVPLSLFVPTWFAALFHSVLPNNAVARVYDLVFALGALQVCVCMAMALIDRAANHILSQTEPDALLAFLGTPSLFDLYDHPLALDQLVTDTLQWASILPSSKLLHLQSLITAAQPSLPPTTPSPPSAKRESWFWSTLVSPSTPTPAEKKRNRATLATPAILSRPPSSPVAPKQKDPTAILHQQIEDLVHALSQLQRDHRQQSEELMSLKQHDLDTHADRVKLQKRNAAMEKKLKKYKLKITQQQQTIQEHAQLNHDDHYRSFIDSLRLSGSFGSLVANGLAADASPTPALLHQQHLADHTKRAARRHSHQPTASTSKRMSLQDLPGLEPIDDASDECDDQPPASPPKDTVKPNPAPASHPQHTQALQQLSSELTAVKLANYEMGQKYEQLCHKYSDLELDLKRANHHATSQADHIRQLAQALDEHDQFQDSIVHEWSQEQESLLLENEDWMDKALAARKMASDLHMEKLSLAKQVERLEKQIQHLETEKREYLMPRDSFAEDVFATHHLFFGQPAPDAKSSPTQEADEYRQKFVEADLRCRELEKLLAEAKVKIADYEASSDRPSTSTIGSFALSTSTTPASSVCCSPRSSFQQRSASLAAKRSSTLSMLSQHRSSTFTPLLQTASPAPPPLSPTACQPPMSPTNTNTTTHSYQTRLSNESCASSATSVTSLGSKRSSLLLRLSPATFAQSPLTNPTLSEEPEALAAE